MQGRKTSYREPDVWQKACDLTEEVYRVTRSFPSEEQYGLTTQMRRAAVSVPANIAEGAGRWGSAELRRFLSIARGSLAELRTLVELARRLRYLEPEAASDLDSDMEEIDKMLYSLHRKLAPEAA